MISYPVAAAVLALMLLGGVVMIVVGARPLSEEDLSAPRAERLQRLKAIALTRASRRQWRAAGVAAGVGFALAILTGWVVLIVALPVAVLGLPLLLQTSEGKETIARLEALEEWTRSLSGILGVGIGLEQAIIATLSRSTPAAIRDEVATLVARLHGRWSTKDALRAFADDLADPTADSVIAGLILISERRGGGLQAMLQDTASRASEEVRNRRRVEADLAKPRAIARWLTLLTLAVIALLMLFDRDYIEAYSSPVGQTVFVVLAGLYVTALVWMRRMTKPSLPPRLLGYDAQPRTGDVDTTEANVQEVTS